MAKPKFKSPLAAAWKEMERKVQAERAARGPSKPKKAPKHIADPVFGKLSLVGRRPTSVDRTPRHYEQVVGRISVP